MSPKKLFFLSKKMTKNRFFLKKYVPLRYSILKEVYTKIPIYTCFTLYFIGIWHLKIWNLFFEFTQNNLGLRLLGVFRIPCLFVFGPTFSFIGQPVLRLQEVNEVEDKLTKTNKHNRQHIFFILNLMFNFIQAYTNFGK